MSDDTEETPAFAAVAYTPAQLDTLLLERPHEWRWAAFASVLVQRREAARSAKPSAARERVFNTRQLWDLAREVIYGTEALGEELCEVILRPEFMGAFGAKDSDAGADADAILHNANLVMDYYDRYVALGQRAETAAAPTDFVAALKNTAKVVDLPLAGMDEFIQHYVDVVRLMPPVILAARGKNLEEPVPLKLHMDNDLMQRIIDQLNELDGAA